MNEIRTSNKWKNLTEFQRKVLEVTKRIPKGKVSTYGQIAQVLGGKNYSRAVGNALNKNPFAPTIPCHRVVKNTGKIGGFAKGSEEKIVMLKKENIKITNEKINLKQYLVNLELIKKD